MANSVLAPKYDLEWAYLFFSFFLKKKKDAAFTAFSALRGPFLKMW